MTAAPVSAPGILTVAFGVILARACWDTAHTARRRASARLYRHRFGDLSGRADGCERRGCPCRWGRR